VTNTVRKPGPGYSIGGFRPTGQVRLRTVFLGFTVMEELIEYRDGRRVWERADFNTSREISNEVKS